MNDRDEPRVYRSLSTQNPQRRRVRRTTVLTLASVAALASATLGQESEAAQPGPKKAPATMDNARDDGWNVRGAFEALYDDNVFYLSDDSRDRLRENRASDQTSGRFDDMNSASDVVLTTELKLERKVTDADGRDFRLEPSVAFLEYLENPRKSHPEFALDLRQRLASSSALDFSVDYRKDVFAGNYLADAVDFVGSVSSSERRYEPGIYDEWFASATFEQRLWRRSEESWGVWRLLGVRRLDGEAMVGTGRRWYDAPFTNRDRDRVTARLRLEAQLGRDWKVRGGYRYDWDVTDNGREVMIRDEDDFNRDFNGDGDRVDQNVRAFERVDRSKTQQTVEARVTWDFAKQWSAEVDGSLEVQDYLSDEPFDTSDRDRVDRRRELELRVKWRFLESWTASLFGGVVRERSNRGADPSVDDQDVDYNDHFAGIGVSARF